MKSKFLVIIRIAALLAALLPARALRASDENESDPGGNVRVDVVVDMSDEGHKIARPTPDKPAYYLPISVGYKKFGYTKFFQRPPSNEWDVERALAVALYNQGYRLMTKEGHPSLVLVFWWGYMAPADVQINDSHASQVTKPGAFQSSSSEGVVSGFYGGGSIGGPNTGNFVGAVQTRYPFYYLPGEPQNSSYAMVTVDAASSPFAFSVGVDNFNEDFMQRLVAGDTIDDHEKYPDPRLDEVGTMCEQPRYYMMVTALDFNDWLHHKVTMLWKAHVSTELWGHYFDQVIGTMINTAAPEFGRESKVPHFYGAEIMPLGRVILGTPQVTDFANKPK